VGSLVNLDSLPSGGADGLVCGMNTRRLGWSDLEVSEISLGSWLTFSGGVGLEQTRACTNAAFEAGINFFDTANVYGRGAAETAWGEILAGRARESCTAGASGRHPPLKAAW
jgi:aryl-alcohol dehydrogenase-like predicted oxidoreductase